MPKKMEMIIAVAEGSEFPLEEEDKENGFYFDRFNLTLYSNWENGNS